MAYSFILMKKGSPPILRMKRILQNIEKQFNRFPFREINHTIIISMGMVELPSVGSWTTYLTPHP
jgi:hypothetical protein